MDGQTDVRRTLHGGKGRAVQSVARGEKYHTVTLHRLAHSKLTCTRSLKLVFDHERLLIEVCQSLVSPLTLLPRIQTKEKHKWLRVEYTNGDGNEEK